MSIQRITDTPEVVEYWNAYCAVPAADHITAGEIVSIKLPEAHWSAPETAIIRTPDAIMAFKAEPSQRIFGRTFSYRSWAKHHDLVTAEKHLHDAFMILAQGEYPRHLSDDRMTDFGRHHSRAANALRDGRNAFPEVYLCPILLNQKLPENRWVRKEAAHLPLAPRKFELIIQSTEDTSRSFAA